MSDKAVLKRTNRAAQEFQSFVRQNSISTRDTDMLARWGESRKNYYIMLYHDQRQILEIGWWGADSAAVDAYSLKEQMASVVYPIVFRDGTFYAVIYDNSDSGLYDLLWIVSLLLGCAVLALTLLAYNRRVARRVVAISQEVQSIGAGNLYLQLEPKGRDEISQLTASVEQMRLSLLRKTSEEQRALQQNSDLITAMSHDIRNPLTALLGYLDLAKNGQYRSEDELQSYLDAAYGKAEQLKTLTDELFRGSRDTPVWCMIYDELVYEHEADIFANQQKFVKRLSPYEVFTANLEAGNDDQLIIRDLLESYGLSLGTRKAPCVICAVSTLEQIYQTHGYHMLSRVLRLCAGTWEGDENSFSANILNGITRLVYTFGDQLNDEVFKERVGALSIKQLVRMSKERCPGSMGYAEAMLLEYNGKKKNISQRLSMNKLHMQGTAGLCSLLSDVDTSPEAATAEGVSE